MEEHFNQPTLFGRSLMLSFMIHLIVLGSWSLYPKSPRFSVAVGPTSMEIIFLETDTLIEAATDNEGAVSQTQKRRATSEISELSFNNDEKILYQGTTGEKGVPDDVLFNQIIDDLPRKGFREGPLNPKAKNRVTAMHVTDFSEFNDSRGALIEAQPLSNMNEAPIYPRLARKKGWEGTVLLKAKVEKDGMASQVKIEDSSGYSILDNSALYTVREWQFSPAQSGPLRFSSWIRIPVEFQLIGEH
jgi:TonB family protein